jgi:hypothetical protein
LKFRRNEKGTDGEASGAEDENQIHREMSELEIEHRVILTCQIFSMWKLLKTAGFTDQNH